DVDVTNNLDGLNLVANPYPTAIDANAFFNNLNNSTVTTGTAYLWNDGGSNTGTLRGGDYVTVNSMGTSTGRFDPGTGVPGLQDPNSFDGHFNSFQGFYVDVNQNGVVSFTPDMQVVDQNDTDGFFRQQSDRVENRDVLKLSLNGNHYYNDIIIGLDANATLGDDYSLDAKKLAGNEDLSFYSIFNDQEYSILALPFDITTFQEIRLGIEVSQKGRYELAVEELASQNNSFDYVLIDHLSGESYDVTSDLNLVFELEEGSHLQRFSLAIKGRVTVVDEQLNKTISLSKTGQSLLITYPEGGNEIVSIHDLQGKKLFEKTVDFTQGKNL
ncbi:MAG: hypothetical protein AAFY41_19035, partial [Bacteroidota bacterium]